VNRSTLRVAIAPGLMALALSLTAPAFAAESPGATTATPVPRERPARRTPGLAARLPLPATTAPAARIERPRRGATVAVPASELAIDAATWAAIDALFQNATALGYPDPAGGALVPVPERGWAIRRGEGLVECGSLAPLDLGPDGTQVPVETWLERSRGLRLIVGLPDSRSLPGFSATEVRAVRSAAPVLATLPELDGDDAGNAWALVRLAGPARDACLWAAVCAAAAASTAPPAPLIVALDAPLIPDPPVAIMPRPPLPTPVEAARAHLAGWFLARARGAALAGDDAEARRWHGAHARFAGAQADRDLPAALAWATAPAATAPLAERLAAWDPFADPDLPRLADRDGLLALLDDPRPCRWFDPRLGGAPRSLGDQALRALAVRMGIDPRLPAGIDPGLPWDDRQRRAAAGAVRGMVAAGVGPALVRIAAATDPGVLCEAVASLTAGDRTAVVRRLAEDGWATVQDPVLAARLLDLVPDAAQAALVGAIPGDPAHPLAAVAALWHDRQGDEGPVDRLVAGGLAGADDGARLGAIALTCARPNATRAALVRTAVLADGRRAALAALIDPGPVAAAATVLDAATATTDATLAAAMRRALAALLLADRRPLPALVADGDQWTWDGLVVAIGDGPAPTTARAAVLATLAGQPGLFGLETAPGEPGPAAARNALLAANQGLAALRLLGVAWPELGEDL
jgi:hypothetical protein